MRTNFLHILLERFPQSNSLPRHNMAHSLHQCGQLCGQFWLCHHYFDYATALWPFKVPVCVEHLDVPMAAIEKHW
jgi:hypothetical protein